MLNDFGFAEIVTPTISFPEFERFFAIPEPIFFGNGELHFPKPYNDLYLSDRAWRYANIGRYAHMIVRDTDSRPYTPDLVRAFAEHLECQTSFGSASSGIHPNSPYPYSATSCPISRIASRAVVQRCKAIFSSSSIMNIPFLFCNSSRPEIVVSPIPNCFSLRQG